MRGRNQYTARFDNGGLCKKGHQLTPENIFHNGSTGRRQCRLCRNEWQYQYTRRPGKCNTCGSPWKHEKYKVCDKCRKYMADRHQAHRQQVLDHYGRGCACCDEWREAFLVIDHVNRNGNKHRKEIGASNFYKWLIDNGFPAGFRTLCHNCNFATSRGEACPHEKEREHGNGADDR
jgi:hypothetical protein